MLEIADALASGMDVCLLYTSNEGINNISIAIEESAKGVTNVAQEISQLVTAISAITVQADENKNLSEDLSDEVAKFEKV